MGTWKIVDLMVYIDAYRITLSIKCTCLHANPALYMYENKKGADDPAQSRSLISISVDHFSDSISTYI